MPADEGIRLGALSSIAPREHSAQSCHHPARSIIGLSWFDLPFLKQRQLLPQEQIFGGKRAARPELEAIRRPKSRHTIIAVKRQWRTAASRTNGAAMNAQDRTLQDVTSCSRMLRSRFLRTAAAWHAYLL